MSSLVLDSERAFPPMQSESAPGRAYVREPQNAG